MRERPLLSLLLLLFVGFFCRAQVDVFTQCTATSIIRKGRGINFFQQLHGDEPKSFSQGVSIETDASNNIYTCGQFDRQIRFEKHLTSPYSQLRKQAGTPDYQKLAYAAKYLRNGALAWSKQIPSCNDLITSSIPTTTKSSSTSSSSISSSPPPLFNSSFSSSSSNYHNFTFAAEEEFKEEVLVVIGSSRSTFFSVRSIATGDELWKFGEDYGDVDASAIAASHVAPHHVFIAGYFSEDFVQLDNAHVLRQIDDGGWTSSMLIKVDVATRSILWTRSIRSLSDCFAVEVATDYNGDVVAVGQLMKGVFQFANAEDYQHASDANYTTCACKTPYCMFVAKYDGVTGAVKWVLCSSSTNTGQRLQQTGSFAHAASIDSKNNVYVAGTFETQLILGDGAKNFTLERVGSGEEMFLCKINASGYVQFLIKLGHPPNSKAYGVRTDQRNNIVIAGEINLLSLTSGFISKRTPTGALMWLELYGSPTPGAVTIVNSIALDKNDSILATGKLSIESQLDHIKARAIGLDDGFVLRVREGCSCSDPECSIPLCYARTPFDDRACAGRGSCVGPNQCQCESVFTGEVCEINVCYGKTELDGDVCSGHGLCIRGGKCICNEYWTGDLCDIAKCFGKYRNNSVCSGNGRCIGPDRCQCNSDYSGQECETPVKYELKYCDKGSYWKGIEDSVSTTWYQSYNNTVSRTVAAVSALLPNGDIVVAGFFEKRIDHADVFVMRYSPSGTVKWHIKDQVIDTGSLVLTEWHGMDVVTDDASNIYILGQHARKIVSSGYTHQHIFIMKVSGDGSIRWMQYPDPLVTSFGYGEPKTMAINKQHNILLISGMYEGTFSMGNCTAKSSAYMTSFLARIDVHTGACLWMEVFEVIQGFFVLTEIAMDTDDSPKEDNLYRFVGIATIIGQAIIKNQVITALRSRVVTIFKMEDNIKLEEALLPTDYYPKIFWLNTYDLQGLLEECAFDIDGHGDIIAAVGFSNPVSIGGFHFDSVGVLDVMLFKTDSQGNVKWATSFGAFEGYLSATGVAVDKITGSIFVTGDAQSTKLVIANSTEIELADTADNQIPFVLRFSSTGKYEWIKLPTTKNMSAMGYALALDANLHKTNLLLTLSIITQRRTEDYVFDEHTVFPPGQNLGFLYLCDEICQGCPVGTYSQSTHSVSADSCIPCPPGNYSNKEGSSKCLPCEEGTYSSEMGVAACWKCTSNTYSDEKGLTKCKACPWNQRALLGATYCEDILSTNQLLVVLASSTAVSIGIISCLLITILAVVLRARRMNKKKGLLSQRKRKHTVFDFPLLQDDDLQNRDQLPQLFFHEKMFLIPFAELEDLYELATGGSGAVILRAKWKQQYVAVKVFRTKLLLEKESFEGFERELEILANLRHTNIIQFYGACIESTRICFVTEFCERGSLKDVIDKEGKSMSWEKKLRILLDVASGMTYLHSKNLIHRDLKAENVLIDRNYVAKVSDFGNSRLLEGKQAQARMTRLIGTSYYIAPEVTLGKQYNEKCDIFSYSIIMFEILTQQMNPYDTRLALEEMSYQQPQQLQEAREEEEETTSLSTTASDSSSINNSDMMSLFRSSHNKPATKSMNIELCVAQDETFRPLIPEEYLKEEEYQWFVELMQRCWSHGYQQRPSFAEIKAIMEDKLSVFLK